MSAKTISTEEVRWFTWGDDANGRVFLHEGDYYRAILPRSAAFFRDLLTRGILADLARKNLIVDTEETDLSMPGYALILRHEKLPFVSYPHEWSFSMLQDAARLVIRLNRELLAQGLVLADCHAMNVVFRGATPIYVDIGSIVPYTPEGILPDYADFLSQYVYPLVLQERVGLTRIVKNLQMDELAGISPEEFHHLARKRPPLSFFVGKRHVNSESLNTFLQGLRGNARLRFLRPLIDALCRLAFFGPSAPAGMALDLLEKQIEAVRIRPPRGQWSDYYETNPAERVEEMARRKPEEMDLRSRQICEAIRRAAPRTLIDLAGNEGLYSVAATRLGVTDVVCADYDLAAVEKLYRSIRGTGSSILPLYLNVMMPGSGSRSIVSESRTVYARMQCDMALALALTHHLSLSQHIPFESIAWTLAGYTNKRLLVEFMPFGLGIGNPSANLPDWYTLENFVRAFRKYFPHIEVQPTNLECNERVLLVCSK